MNRDRWGVFQRGDGTVQVVPVNSDGTIDPAHIFGLKCPCGPAKDDSASMLIIHEEVQ